MTTWAMKSLYGAGWIACDARTAIDAVGEGIEVRLMTYVEVLSFTGLEYDNPVKEAR